ncbi:MAG: helicase-exonuclease AddAB subunit AddA [Lachnospiraceae bacterium]|nr:helicase-exonuclease AddAB subunit AddA [Lachnospiraceae bacterium]
MTFTEEQQSVIDARDADLLVSAAAGSGKTAVLIERIFQRITKDRVDVDRLLVVTFTRAAAAQMKERIRRRIDEALLADPSDEILRRQELLLPHAPIMTIDAFCQDVIRNHFTAIDIDPQMRVLDDGERRLLMQDVTEAVMDACYEEKDPAFLHMTDCYISGVEDTPLTAMIHDLFAKAMSKTDPEAWLLAQIGEEEDSEEAFGERFEVAFVLKETAHMLREAQAMCESAIEICLMPDGPAPYEETLKSDIRKIREAAAKCKGASYDTVREVLLGIRWDRLRPVRSSDDTDPALQQAARDLRDDMKGMVASFIASFFTEPLSEVMRQSHTGEKAYHTLIRTTLRFMEAFALAKAEKNVIDFHDMEHLALSILLEKKEEDGVVRYVPSDVAREYRTHFAEVMVDEYQDSNPVQEMIVCAICGVFDTQGGRIPRFMVGDVKQSIYRFRMARPELFTEKMSSFSKDKKAAERRIDLHVNFRSRPQVLAGVNAVFRGLMGQDLGGIDYDEDAHLVPGPLYDGDHEDGTSSNVTGRDAYRTELIIGEKKEDDVTDEALLCAVRIRSLIETLQVRDEETGRLRPLRYGDIAVLMRAQAGRDDTFRRVFEAQGIPVYVESRTGYFDAWEVQIMLDALSVLHNPLQDVKLCAVMHSVIGGFEDDDLARIRAEAMEQGGPDWMYTLVQRMADKGTDDPLSVKCASFISLIGDLRRRLPSMPVHELISELGTKSGFFSFISAMPGGERRMANITALMEKARAFEKTSYRGLARFIGYIEALKKYRIDEGEANLLDERADVVRIMSIHKSKGLEFGVVFVTGLSKKINRQDAQGELVIDDDFGGASMFHDPELRLRMTTLRRSVLAHKVTSDLLGEELRILYVAMTRAREKLILTAVSPDIAREEARFYTPAPETDGCISYMARRDAQQALVWLRQVRAHIRESVDLSFIGFESLMQALETQREDALDRYTALTQNRLTGRQRSLQEGFESRFTYTYAHPAYAHFFAKTTVTELKEAALDEGTEETALHPYRAREAKAELPHFLSGHSDADETAADGARRGTLYHRVMERLPAQILGCEAPEEKLTEMVDAYMRGEIQKGYLEEETLRLVAPEDIARFLMSPVAARMRRALGADHLYRERQFMIGLPARTIDETLPEEEMTLVQGVIDCYFMEEDGLVILDYKTDRVREAEELRRRYETQLAYYAKALTRLTGCKVRECLIYSFALQEEIVCDIHTKV